jgi:peptide/nickel transport system ATP-binding protein
MSALVSVEDLRVYFGDPAKPVRAVDGVSFSIHRGETVALVGESGCGKSVTSMALARLVPQPPGVYAGGRVLLNGRDVLTMKERELRALRGNEVSYIFQDPGASLNPVFRIGYQIAEAMRLHRRDVHFREETRELLRLVGMTDPDRAARAYPHELSGGMQQRAMIAMALACRPKLLVADEPTTALDVTIQAQILELLVSLQKQLGMAILLITHNLGLVAGVAHRVHVMYAGQMVEAGLTEDVLRRPKHPYTRGLLNAVPRLTGSRERLTGIEGVVPNPARLPTGCRFHPRCPYARDICVSREPEAESAAAQHEVRCHVWREVEGAP